MLMKGLGELVKNISESMGHGNTTCDFRFLGIVLEEVKKDVDLIALLRDSRDRLKPILQKCQDRINSEEKLEDIGWGKIYRRRIAEIFDAEVIDCLVDNDIKPVLTKANGKDIYELLERVDSGELKLEELPLLYQRLLGYTDNGSEENYLQREEAAKGLGFIRGFRQIANSLTDDEMRLFVENDVRPSKEYRSRTLIKDLIEAKERDGNINSFLARYLNKGEKDVDWDSVKKLRGAGFSNLYAYRIAEKAGSENVDFLIKNGIVPNIKFGVRKIEAGIDEANEKGLDLGFLKLRYQVATAPKPRGRRKRGSVPNKDGPLQKIVTDFWTGRKEGVHLNLDDATEKLKSLGFGDRYSNLFCNRYPMAVAAIIAKGEGPEFYGGIRKLNQDLKELDNKTSSQGLEERLNDGVPDYVSSRDFTKEGESGQKYRTIKGPTNSSLRKHLVRLNYTKAQAKEVVRLGKKYAIFAVVNQIAPKPRLPYELIINLMKGNMLEDLSIEHKRAYMGQELDIFGVRLPLTKQDRINRLRGLGYSNEDSEVLVESEGINAIIRENVKPFGQYGSDSIMQGVKTGNTMKVIRDYYHERAKFFDAKRTNIVPV